MPMDVQEQVAVAAGAGVSLEAAIEAVLITAERAVPSGRLAEALAGPLGLAEAPREGAVREAVASLNRAYAESGRSFRVESVAGGFRLMTLPQFAPCIAAFQGQRGAAKLSRAAVESLAIVAYRQPLTRAQLEAIRGVACGEVLKTLLERRLIAVQGRAEELGRPLLYGTTKEFLNLFGLASIKDLPTAAELAPP
jgi:segregation and condensation protein B